MKKRMMCRVIPRFPDENTKTLICFILLLIFSFPLLLIWLLVVIIWCTCRWYRSQTAATTNGIAAKYRATKETTSKTKCSHKYENRFDNLWYFHVKFYKFYRKLLSELRGVSTMHLCLYG